MIPVLINSTRPVVTIDPASGVIVLRGSGPMGLKGDDGVGSLLDLGGTEKRCLIQARYVGKNDADEDLWVLEPVTA